ncbi:MAG: hypothetical protein JW822_09700 [Spirochaetales bacterium]|nr:hypothetical protein [Spirochaetales bacterium]
MRRACSRVLIIILSAYGILFLSTCNFAPFEGEAQVTLDLGWLTPTDGEESAIRASTVQGAPTNIQDHITSIEITISGPGVNTTTKTYYEWPQYLSVSVPPGKERTITLRINVDAASPNAVLVFGGETTVSLKVGQQTKAVMKIVPKQMKLLAPDYQLQRLYKYNDIDDSTREEASAASLRVGVFRPYDVDIDSSGKIYIANSLADSILRIDEVTATGGVVVGDPMDNPVALTIDRYNNIMYYASSSLLYRYDIENDITTALNKDAVNIIRGMHADTNGLLYIVGSNSFGQPRLFVFDPEFVNVGLPEGKVIDEYPSAHFATPWDVVVKGNYIYITNLYGNDGWQIIRLTKSLSDEIGFGTVAGSTDISNGAFYGPHRFISKINERITIIDDNSSFDKIISIDDVPASFWKTIPNTAVDGQALFNFYEGF